ncbi:MAG: hypothetical protein H6698_00215 [Myxococcales bacterium]|nr:hypothetical protein [Myxococcales bacterium]MCB9531614.1 hypothetical protein [Myxococcales bacterium]MCB9532735.1 hypothetical protein [Myxococcales bacterium]
MAIDRNKVTAAAQKYIQKGAYSKAIKEYKAIMKEFPDDVRTLLKIGDLEARDGKALDAARTYNEVADYYVAHGFFPKAVAAYKLLLGVQPANIDAKLRLADLYYQLGLLRDALANFQEVAAHYNERGATDAYLRTLHRIVDIDPDNAGNRIKLAEELARFGEDAVAAEQFLIAGATLKKTGRFEEYARVMERYVHLVPADLQRVHDLARVYLQQNRPKRALVRIQAAFRDDPRDPATVDILVRALDQLGERSRAVAVLEELAAAFHEEGAVDARDEICRRLLTIDPHHALARSTLGIADEAPVMTFELVDDHDVPPGSATPSAATGAAAPPSGAVAEEVEKLLSETDVYLKYNLFERALGHLQKVFVLDPVNVGALERKKTALLATGQTDLGVAVLIGLARETHATNPAQAEAYLAEARKASPDNPAIAAVVAELTAPSAAPVAAPAAAARPSEHATAPPAPDESFERLDALFDDFSVEDTSVGHVALGPDFLAELAPDGDPAAPVPDDADIITFASDDLLPEELDAGLALVDALVAGDDVENARTTLFELLGDFPEHAELLLRQMDLLPAEPDPAPRNDFDSDPSSIRATPEGLVAEPVGASEEVAQPDEPDQLDDELLFADDDLDELDSAEEPATIEVAAPFAESGASNGTVRFPRAVVVEPGEDAASAGDAEGRAGDALGGSGETLRLRLTDPADAAGHGSLAISTTGTLFGAVTAPHTGGDAARPGPSTSASRTDRFRPALEPEFASEPSEMVDLDHVISTSGAYTPVSIDEAAAAAAAAITGAHPATPPSGAAATPDTPLPASADLETPAGSASNRHDAFGALDRLLGASGSHPRVASGSARTVTEGPATAPVHDVDDLDDGIEISDFDEPEDDVEFVDVDLDSEPAHHTPTPVGPADAAPPAPEDLAYEAAAARAAVEAKVDAPIGRASSLVFETFGPADRVIDNADDAALAEAIQARRDGNGMFAMLALQEAEQGPYAVAASFELALANIEMGLYFEGISALEQLLGNPDLVADDRMLVHYHLGIAYEAMDQSSLAEANFRVLAEAAPESYPDVYIRLQRLAQVLA